jgi:hypothetical protein
VAPVLPNQCTGGKSTGSTPAANGPSRDVCGGGEVSATHGAGLSADPPNGRQPGLVLALRRLIGEVIGTAEQRWILGLGMDLTFRTASSTIGAAYPISSDAPYRTADVRQPTRGVSQATAIRVGQTSPS